MMAEPALVVVGIAFYVVASVWAILFSVGQTPSKDLALSRILLIGSVPFVAVLAIRGFGDGRIPAIGRFESITSYALAVAFVFTHLATRYRVRGIAGIVVPYVTILLCFAAPGLKHEIGAYPETRNLWLGLHIASSFVGYAFFTVASVLAVIYLVQDRNLKRRQLGRTFNMFPSLETLDRLMYRQIGFAFLTFTSAVALGFLLTRQIGWPENWLTDPKIVATLVTWFVFASLFHLRAIGDRHGRRMAIATVGGLACLLFTFVGVHLLTDSVHDFVFMTIAGN